VKIRWDNVGQKKVERGRHKVGKVGEGWEGREIVGDC